MLGRIVGLSGAWVRRHPILTGIWLLFVALCIGSLFTYPDDQTPNYVMGGLVLPVLALLTLVYMGRTIDRYRALREYTRKRPPTRPVPDRDDPADIA